MLNKYVMFFGRYRNEIEIDEGSPVDIIYLDIKQMPLTKYHIKDYYLN